MNVQTGFIGRIVNGAAGLVAAFGQTLLLIAAGVLTVISVTIIAAALPFMAGVLILRRWGTRTTPPPAAVTVTSDDERSRTGDADEVAGNIVGYGVLNQISKIGEGLAYLRQLRR